MFFGDRARRSAVYGEVEACCWFGRDICRAARHRPAATGELFEHSQMMHGPEWRLKFKQMFRWRVMMRFLKTSMIASCVCAMCVGLAGAQDQERRRSPEQRERPDGAERRRERGPREGRPGQGGPREGRPGQGGPREGRPGQGGQREGGPREGRPGQGGPGQGRPGQGGPGQGGFYPPNPLLMALDANRDGKISASEMQNAAAALKSLDKNKDGAVTMDELRPEGGRGGFGRPEGGRGGFGRPEGGRGGSEGPPQGGRGFGRGSGRPPQGDGPGNSGGGATAEAFVKRLMSRDENGDGKISKDELPAQMQRILDRADTNKDGAIDEQEAKKMAERFSAGGRGGSRSGGGSRTRSRGGRSGGTRPQRPERPQQDQPPRDKSA